MTMRTDEEAQQWAVLNRVASIVDLLHTLNSENHGPADDPHANPANFNLLIDQQHLQTLYDRFRWDLDSAENHGDWDFFTNQIYNNGNQPRINGVSGPNNKFPSQGFHVEKQNGEFILDLHIADANHIFTFENSALLIIFLNNRFERSA